MKTHLTWLLCATLLNWGCTTYVKTSQIREKNAHFKSQVDNTTQQIHSDFKLKESYALQVLGSSTLSPEQSAGLKKNLSALRSAYSDYQKESNSLAKTQTKINQLAQGKEELLSTQPEWKTFRTEFDNLKDQSKSLQKLALKYRDRSQDITENLGRVGVMKYEPGAIVQNINANKKSFETQKAELDQRVAKIKGDPRISEEQKKALLELDAIILEYQNLLTQYETNMNQILAAHPNPETIVPGSPLARKLASVSEYREKVQNLEPRVKAIEKILSRPGK
jgi:hypothetical protein